MKVSQVKGTEGICNGGSVPLMGEMSPTVLVLMPKTRTTANTAMIAASEAGNFLVTFGKKKVMATVNATRLAMVIMVLPCKSTC